MNDGRDLNSAPGEGFTPKEEFLIEDVETLKVVADPYRMEMIEAIGSDHLTAKEWAARLGTGVNKLYYHIRLLEKHGLLVVVDERVVSGILEKTYALSAHRFEVRPGLLSAGEEGDESLDAMVASLLENTGRAVRAAYSSGAFAPDDKEHTLFFRGRLRLTREEAAEFTRRVNALLEEFGRDDTDATVHGLTVVFHPLAGRDAGRDADRQDRSQSGGDQQ